MEVVTDAWDENTMTRTQAIQKFTAVKNWVDARFNEIHGNHQARLGNYYIGSDAANADEFQPKLGYFHSTYGVKLSQVPRLFEKTTAQKDNLTTFGKTHARTTEHADNVQRTFQSIGMAKNALKAIKKLWPRTGGGWFERGAVKSRGTKGWNAGTEEAFLGFITLLTNYLHMFQSGRGGNLAKQNVGMHYYKSDLYNLAGRLPAEVIDTLRDDTNHPGLRRGVIEAIAAAVGLARTDAVGGPLGGLTIGQYLEQIFTGYGGVRKRQNKQNIYDPVLAGSINPYSKKLGPNKMGPAGNKEWGVVVENRHLEYLDPNYATNETNWDTKSARIHQKNALHMDEHGVVNEQKKAKYESKSAKESGSSKRPIDEWVPMMTNIYDMVVDLNQ